MKRLIFTSAIIIGCVSFASAQRAGRATATKTPPVNNTSAMNSASSHTAKAGAPAPGTLSGKSNKEQATVLKIDNRDIYHWKDGQRATPTGNEATGSNDNSYVSLKKNND